jgi:hypothetical protein
MTDAKAAQFALQVLQCKWIDMFPADGPKILPNFNDNKQHNKDAKFMYVCCFHHLFPCSLSSLSVLLLCAARNHNQSVTKNSNLHFYDSATAKIYKKSLEVSLVLCVLFVKYCWR